jgi:hypothetical protein
MFTKNLSLFLCGALLLSLCSAPSTLAKTGTEKDAAWAAKVKAGVGRLGTGKDAVVAVKLRDKRKLTGYVSAFGDESFVVADAKTGAQTRVPYGDVSQVKGNNLSTGATIAIAVGAAVGATLLVLYILVRVHGD